MCRSPGAIWQTGWTPVRLTGMREAAMGRFAALTLGVVFALALSVAPASAQWSIGVHVGSGPVYYPPPAPVYRAPVYRAPVYRAPVYGAPVYVAPYPAPYYAPYPAPYYDGYYAAP